MRVRALITLAAVVAALASCSTDTDSTTASSPATPPTSSAAPAEGVQLGDAITITRTDTGAPVGTIRFTEVVAVPADCVIGTRPGVMLAVRVQIDNGPGEQLPVPDAYSLRTTDTSGATIEVETASIHSRCATTYPEAATAPVGQSTEGWVTVRAVAAPAELVYAPYVGDQASTAEDIRMLTVTPASTRVRVPQLAQPVQDPAPETSERVKPSDKPVPPPTDIDSEGRPTGSGGELIECAGEDYQPGTGVFADGSLGYAPECLADR